MSRRPVVPVGPLTEFELRAIAEAYPKNEAVKEVALKFNLAHAQRDALVVLLPDRSESYETQLRGALEDQRKELISAIGWYTFQKVVESRMDDESDCCPRCGRGW